MHYHEGREEHEERRHNKPFEPLQCTTNDPVTASFQFQISFFVFFAPFVVASLRTTTIREVSWTPGMGSILLEHGFLTLELSSEVVSFRYRGKGQLERIGTFSTLPENFRGVSHCAEVRVLPGGKCVYVSNRGHDSIAVFQVNDDSGQLERIQLISTGGETPRNFGIDPTGRFLVAANQDSHTILSYRITVDTGQLEPTGVKLTTPSPALICFY